jgi:hypothetical protein
MSRPPPKPSARFVLQIDGANSASHQEQNQVTKQRGTLFVLQRDHRINAQGAACRPKTGTHPYTKEK